MKITNNVQWNTDNTDASQLGLKQRLSSWINSIHNKALV